MIKNETMAQDCAAWDEGLSLRQRAFVVFYCTDEDCFMNGRKAYKKAHTKYKAGEPVYTPSEEVCDVGASKLLSVAKVKAACRRLLAELQPDVDAENIPRLLHDIALQAMYNPADIIDTQGRLAVQSLSELGDKAKCIRQIYQTARGVRVELVDRTKAQDRLLRYYNLCRSFGEQMADGGTASMASHGLASPIAALLQTRNESGLVFFDDDAESIEQTA